MASSSSSSSSSQPRTWRYHVFTSFHGPDARKAFLSHLRKQFRFNGISMFDDQGIERGETIAPALMLGIRESRISIVVLSEKYASSSWCLDELVEIFKCKEDFGQKVMTVFYGVDPSHVRKQTGEFGIIFNKTCARKTKEERRVWSQALTDAGNIAGEHNWDNESNMIEKIARDVSNKLNTTISKDFDDMVGIETHLEKIQSLLHFDDEDGAIIVGISGPAGIGKTTIARAVYSRLSSTFDLSCFMENVSESYNKGLDDHGLKLTLQEQLLSKILNQNGLKIYHLGALPEWLHDKKVLIILDDVDDLEQLEALAYETTWFGHGSRIIVTTTNQELLEQHDINNKYHVDFPAKEDACEILCRKAFRQSLAPYGFEKLVESVTELCGNLPLGLRVIGSTLRGKNEEDWKFILHRLENSLDRKIEGVLIVGYENLHKEDQLLFLLIAVFFNYQDEDHVKAMVAGSNLDVGLGFGLKTLAYRSLIQISTEGKIVMHKLLQQVGREAIQRQDQGKRQIIIDNDEICDVLENDYGSGSVMGISLDISTLSSDVHISAGAFKKIRNLLFLSIYKTRLDRDNKVHVPWDMNFPSRLKLLNWEEYPGKYLPPTFRPEYLVELNLQRNKLEKLWEGIQPLTNLKKMSFENSVNLKELPDLSNATNLERLNVAYCFRLVEIPSSIRNLQKLESLDMEFCVNLRIVPTHLNLASLESVNMFGCCQLLEIPDISKNITQLSIIDTLLQDLPESIRHLSRLQHLYIVSSGVQTLIIRRDEINLNGEELDGLEEFSISGCPKLASLPKLPASLQKITIINCESLETLMPFPSEYAVEDIYFLNCLKLGQEARRVITQQTRNAEFKHTAMSASMNCPSRGEEYRLSVQFSPKQQMVEPADLLWRLSRNCYPCEENPLIRPIRKAQTDYLYMRPATLPDCTTSKDWGRDLDISECAFQINEETNISYEYKSEEEYENDDESLFDGMLIDFDELLR